MHILAGEVIGVFAHVERADEDAASCLQPLDQGGVARGRRMLAIDLRAGQRRQAGDVEQVLDRERNARKRAKCAECAECAALRAPCVECRRLGAGALLRHCRECIEGLAARPDGGKDGVDDLVGAGRARAHSACDLGR